MRPTLEATANYIRIAVYKSAGKSRAALMETEVKFGKFKVNKALLN